MSTQPETEYLFTQNDTSEALRGQTVGVSLQGIQSITLHLRRPKAAKLIVPAVVEDPLAVGGGIWRYKWVVGDLCDYGRHTGEVEVIFADDDKQSFPFDPFHVKAEIA